MSKTKVIITSLAVLAMVNCKSGELKVGESTPINNEEGKEVGTYTRVADKEFKSSYDADANKQTEKIINRKEGKIVDVFYFNNDTGKQEKRVLYDANGQPNKVIIYDDNAKPKSWAAIAGNKVKSVDLFDKKKRVLFNDDGSVASIKPLTDDAMKLEEGN